MSFSLERFELHEMLRCGLDLRRATQAATSLEAAAEAIVRYLHDQSVNEDTGQRECALVRFYKTHPYGALPEELRSFATDLLRDAPARPEMKCLVLLASAGEEPAWNSRHTSTRHRAIPLPSVEIVEQAPMIAQLIREMGLDIHAIVSPEHGLMAEVEEKTYDVFYVEEAEGSPFIPAQEEFVRPYGIRSVLGFGGMLLSGDLYSIILFSRVRIPPGSAGRFRNIALDLRVAISALGPEHTFGSLVPTPPPVA